MIYNNAELYNVTELIAPEQGVGKLPVRIPDTLRLKLNDSAINNAIQCAGCEFRFNLEGDSAEITLSAAMPNAWGAECPVAEIFQGCFQTGYYVIGPEPTPVKIAPALHRERMAELTREYDLPFDSGLTRLILPYRPPVTVVDLQGDVTPPGPGQTPEVKYLAYGSSITHGASAVLPTGTWAMQTARKLGVDLVNLGFGGGAHLEPEIADYIAERDDWHFATLEMGINMLGSFSARQFAERVDYFIERIARAHSDKWIFCIDMFLFHNRDLLDCEEEKGFRRIVREKVEALDMPRLVHLSGTELLHLPEGLTGDLVHPSPAGMDMISDNLVRCMSGRGVV